MNSLVKDTPVFQIEFSGENFLHPKTGVILLLSTKCREKFNIFEKQNCKRVCVKDEWKCLLLLYIIISLLLILLNILLFLYFVYHNVKPM